MQGHQLHAKRSGFQHFADNIWSVASDRHIGEYFSIFASSKMASK